MSPDDAGATRELQRRGATLVFEALPEDVPGYAPAGSAAREACASCWPTPRCAPPSRRRASRQACAARSAPRSGRAGGTGIHSARTSRRASTTSSPISPRKAFDGWLELGVPAAGAMLLDPMTGKCGTGAFGQSARHRARLSAARQRAVADPADLELTWRVGRDVVAGATSRRSRTASRSQVSGRCKFLSGGPVLPRPRACASCAAGRTRGSEASRFAGTARYRVEFDAPAARADAWLLDLGDVREAAQRDAQWRAAGRGLEPAVHAAHRRAR